MKMKRAPSNDKVDLNMTPMIDIVFQLLTFFLFSIKASDTEGNFAVKMPTPTNNPPVDIINEKIAKPMRMEADAEGYLTKIVFNGKTYTATRPNLDNKTTREMNEALTAGAANAFLQVHREVQSMFGTGGQGKNAEIELDCSPKLKYHYVIQAIDAVSGHKEASGLVTPLIEKVKFKPNAGPR